MTKYQGKFKDELIFMIGAVYNNTDLRTRMFKFAVKNGFSAASEIVIGFMMKKNKFDISCSMGICVKEFESELDEILEDAILLLNSNLFKYIDLI